MVQIVRVRDEVINLAISADGSHLLVANRDQLEAIEIHDFTAKADVAALITQAEARSGRQLNEMRQSPARTSSGD